MTSVTLEHGAHPVRLDDAHGSLDVIAQVDDPPAHPIAAPWSGLAVMPAQVRWRLVGPHGAGTRWATAVDFARRSRTARTTDASTHSGRARTTPIKGRYRVYLAHALRPPGCRTGLYRVEVSASDCVATGRLQRADHLDSAPRCERASPTVTLLAPREREVLEPDGQGCSNAGIASRMYLSGKTVEWYVHRIFEALWSRGRRLQPPGLRSPLLPQHDGRRGWAGARDSAAALTCL